MSDDPENVSWAAVSPSLAMSPESRATLDSIFSAADPAIVERFLEEVDQSDYSLDDWADAFEVFEGWLGEQGVTERPLPEMIGYLHCCTLTNAPGIPLGSLKVIVYQLLTTFGFEANSESQL